MCNTKNKKGTITLTISFRIALSGLPARSICFNGSIVASSGGRLERLLFDISSRSSVCNIFIDLGSEFSWLSLRLKLTNDTRLSKRFSSISVSLLNETSQSLNETHFKENL